MVSRPPDLSFEYPRQPLFLFDLGSKEQSRTGASFVLTPADPRQLSLASEEVE